MNNVFVARFEQVSNSESFTADKNGNLPFIGTILAGKAKGSLINGTMFDRQGLIAGQMYLCENFVDAEYPDQQQVRVLTALTALEFMATRKELGEGKLIRTSQSTVDAVAPEAVAEPATVTAEDVV